MRCWAGKEGMTPPAPGGAGVGAAPAAAGGAGGDRHFRFHHTGDCHFPGGLRDGGGGRGGGGEGSAGRGGGGGSVGAGLGCAILGDGTGARVFAAVLAASQQSGGSQ